MRKVIPLLAILGFFSSTSTFAEDLSALRNWSIGPLQTNKPMKMLEELPDVSNCHVRPSPNWATFHWLKRPGESNFVAVVAVTNQPYLNPFAEFDYGPIPDLSRLTKSEAQALWGSSTSTAPQKDLETYKLVSKENQDFFLDLVFNNDHLEKYRVRSSCLSSSPWVSAIKLKPSIPSSSLDSHSE